MKIILAFKSGSFRAIRAWKAVVLYWFISLILSSLIVVPLKASLKAVLGKSMITDKLMQGINIDVLGDMGQSFHSIISSFFGGLFILAMVAILINVFITGGIFDAVKKNSAGFRAGNFFGAAAVNFLPFMIILILLYIIIIALAVIIVVIPFSVAASSNAAPEGTGFRLLGISGVIFIAVLAILLLVADYARAWQSAQSQGSGFRAFGFGFSQTFRTILSSFPVMVVILLFQGLVAYIVFRIMAGLTPVSGGGVFVLLIISQIVMLFNLFIRVVRYAAVTSLMELNPPKEKVHIPFAADTVPDPIAEAI